MQNQADIWYLIINPAAGGQKTARKWTTIQKAFEDAKIPFTFTKSTHKKHATQLAIEAIAAGYRKLIAIGGDGTNNEVINGIMQQKTVPSHEIIYTLLPVGTGNDWVKTHQIPRQLSKWIDMLQKENTTIQDIGLATYMNSGQKGERFFTNIAGLAYDAYLVKYQNEEESWLSTKILYLYLTVICLFKYRLRKARISFDNEIIEDYFYTINAGICRYSGGGMKIVPHAHPNDGLIGLTVARSLSKLKVIFNIHRLFSGGIDQLKEVSLHQTRYIKIEALDKAPTLLEVDGEYLGETPVEISIIPNALQIVVP